MENYDKQTNRPTNQLTGKSERLSFHRFSLFFYGVMVLRGGTKRVREGLEGMAELERQKAQRTVGTGSVFSDRDDVTSWG